MIRLKVETLGKISGPFGLPLLLPLVVCVGFAHQVAKKVEAAFVICISKFI